MDFLKKLFQKQSKVDIEKRFELLGQAGQGSMSKTWRARDSATGREVVLKVLDRGKTRKLESRFPPQLKKPTEGEIAVGLKHSNIVESFEYGTTKNDEQFIVMEYIQGESLAFLIDMQHELLRKNRLGIIVQLGEALAHFHKEGWIHRDLCPRNVLVTHEVQVKLIDFGLVVPNTPPFQAPGNRTGTANYMAPELIKRQKTDQRIDVFSFAVTCFEMFTRELPWESGETLEAVLHHINQPPRDIRDRCPGIDEEVAAAIMQGLERDPRDRWQSITEMLQPIRKTREQLHRKARRRRKSKPD
ncbi:MAG: serine/threonine protein kinase [Planctomycetota bacterium]|jgi:serine/threonine protein kinase